MAENNDTTGFGSEAAGEPTDPGRPSSQPTTPNQAPPQHQRYAPPQQPAYNQEPAAQPTPHSAESGYQRPPLPEHAVPGPAFTGNTGYTGGAEQSANTAHSGSTEYVSTPTAEYATAPASQSADSKRKHSTGAFIAGIALAAILGGAVGGGVLSSFVLANTENSSPVVQQSGGVTLNNPNTATEITGVAMVATPSVVTINVETAQAAGSGSGVIYSEDGYIITNAHVVALDGAAGTDPKIRVKLSDGRVTDGTIVGLAPYADIAVIKIDLDDITPVQIAEEGSVNVGDLAVAIGAPMGLSNTVTNGVVSALNRGISVGSPLIPQEPNTDENEDGNGPSFPWDFRFDTPDTEETPQTGGQVTLPVIQTDASINPGNSGGALLNGQGELIGINVAIASPGASEGTASSAGLGFAIPAALATRVADEIIAGDQPSHGLLGASVTDSSFDTDADANHAGGLIQEVIKGGAAEEAGLKAGDVVTAVDGVPANDGTSVSALIRMHAGGTEITLDYTRNGVAAQTTAVLGTLDW